MKKVFILIIVCLSFASCSSTHNLVYFSDMTDTVDKSAILNYSETLIQPDDILSVSVSSLNPESNILFNKGTVPASSNSTESANITSEPEGYLVDKSGQINFPVIGKIKLASLSKEEAQQRVTDELRKYVKDPIVNIRFLNFKVTVIGEVNKPSTFTIPGEKINVLEALGMAGDMTAYGKRENVLVIREREGIRSMARINVNSKEVFTSPYFYLQQNDIVYVEPENKAKNAQTDTSYRFLPILTATISALAVIFTSVL